MTINEPDIVHAIREYLEQNPHSGATAIHSWVKKRGKGRFGETIIWKVLKSMAQSGELERDEQENKRTFYSLADMSQNISKQLDTIFKDLETLHEKLEVFHKKYHEAKSQTKQNYLFRLMDLVEIARKLMKIQAIVSLLEGFAVFRKHKSWKNITTSIDDTWDSIRGNAGHQSGHNEQENKFFQELIWSVQGYHVEESLEKYSGFK
jgi:hypothetical protein